MSISIARDPCLYHVQQPMPRPFVQDEAVLRKWCRESFDQLLLDKMHAPGAQHASLVRVTGCHIQLFQLADPEWVLVRVIAGVRSLN